MADSYDDGIPPGVLEDVPDSVASSTNSPTSGGSAAGVGLSQIAQLFSGVTSGIASANSYASKSAAESFNAQVQEQNATNIGKMTALNETNLRLSQAQKIGQQRANLAQAGIGPISSGSAGLAVNQSEVNANMQALTERYRGNVAQTNALNSQALDNYYAKVASQNRTTSEIGTGASALGSLFSGYNKYVQAGGSF